MTPYVLGFGFYKWPGGLQVALIEKKKPDWQKGKLNGIGGKIELNESPIDAMVREFKEETDLSFSDWKLFCQSYDDKNYYVYCYSGFLTEEPTTTTDEVVGIYSVQFLPSNVMPNLRWLIPMASSFDHGERADQFVVKECIKS